MSIPETYLQTSWGESIDDVTMEDIEEIIAETIESEEEPASFWVGIFKGNSEIILEAHKDLTVVGTLEDDENEEIKAQFKTWAEIEDLYKLFLAKDFDQVASILKKNK
ncbi:MAG: hypothetical protein ABIN24_01415 [Dyadobacter sp.]